MQQTRLIGEASRILGEGSAARILVGFDGFVDEIFHLVDERTGADSFQRMNSMTTLSERIADAAGLSTNIEMVSQGVKLGGNGPILANAMTRFGHRVTYVGALGKPEIHPVFETFVEECDRVISIADPAYTDALEFHDGKVMFGKMNTLAEVTWESFLAVLPRDGLRDLLAESDLLACLNWTMLPYMNGIYKGMADLLGEIDARPKVLIDLTDPRKRSDDDIVAAVSLLQDMQAHADVILGMNENESSQVATVLGIDGSKDILYRTEAVREHLGISLAVVHPIGSAYAANENGAWHVHGPFTATPKLTTGAGDVFNSGFCQGLLSGCTPVQALACGVCASGFYVRQCRSATRDELLSFMTDWAATDCGSI